MPFLHDTKPSLHTPLRKRSSNLCGLIRTFCWQAICTRRVNHHRGRTPTRSGIGADPDGFLRRPIAPVQDLGSAEDSNSGGFAYSAGNPRSNQTITVSKSDGSSM